MENVNEVFEERDQRKGRCSREEDEELKGPFCVAFEFEYDFNFFLLSNF